MSLMVFPTIENLTKVRTWWNPSRPAAPGFTCKCPHFIDLLHAVLICIWLDGTLNILDDATLRNSNLAPHALRSMTFQLVVPDCPFWETINRRISLPSFDPISKFSASKTVTGLQLPSQFLPNAPIIQFLAPPKKIQLSHFLCLNAGNWPILLFKENGEVISFFQKIFRKFGSRIEVWSTQNCWYLF